MEPTADRYVWDRGTPTEQPGARIRFNSRTLFIPAEHVHTLASNLVDVLDELNTERKASNG